MTYDYIKAGAARYAMTEAERELLAAADKWLDFWDSEDADGCAQAEVQLGIAAHKVRATKAAFDEACK